MNFLKKRHLFLGCALLVIVIFYLNFQKVRVKVIQIFKQDAVLVKYNAQGKEEGQITQYLAGKIYVTTQVVNGVKQGWEIMYYDNGQVKSKTYFVNGIPAGKGYLYNNAGQLLYSGNYKRGKPYGDWYNYYENGQKKKYLLYDIDKHIAFSVDYDRNGQLQLNTMNGLVVSPNFYSIDTASKAIIPLGHERKEGEVFKNIKDLYLTVTNADKTRLSVKVNINGDQYNFHKVINSTIKISNAFSKKGAHRILIETHLYNLDGEVINGINFRDLLMKL